MDETSQPIDEWMETVTELFMRRSVITQRLKQENDLKAEKREIDRQIYKLLQAKCPKGGVVGNQGA